MKNVANVANISSDSRSTQLVSDCAAEPLKKMELEVAVSQTSSLSLKAKLNILINERVTFNNARRWIELFMTSGTNRSQAKFQGVEKHMRTLREVAQQVQLSFLQWQFSWQWQWSSPQLVLTGTSVILVDMMMMMM